MAHNPLVRNPVTLWTTGSTVLVTELQDFDTNLTGAVNGVGGSCHAPANQSVIGGAGLSLTGPCVVGYGGTFTSQDTGGIACEDGDYPEYGAGHAGTTQVRASLLADGAPLNDALYQSVFNQQDAISGGVPEYSSSAPWMAPAVWRRRMSDFGVQALASSVDFSDGLGQRTLSWRANLRAYNASTLTGVALSFKVGFPHTDLPGAMPAARVVRIDADGNVEALTSVAAGADANGYVSVPKPTSGAAWTAGGALQTLSVPCDQNNFIDVGTYAYGVELVEESGLTGYPWQVTILAPATAAVATATAVQTQALVITDAETVAIDGVNVGAYGERVLFISGAFHASHATNVPYSAGWVTTSAGTGSTVNIFVVTTPGTSGSSSPTLNAGVGATTQDGTVTWTCVAVDAPDAPSFPAPFQANGLWNATYSFWQRSVDFDSASDFTQGMIVPVALGGALGGALLQVSPTVTAWTPGVTLLPFVTWGSADDETPSLVGSQMFAHGIIWLAAVATYTGIADTAFD